MGTFALWDGMLLLKQSDIAAALTMEANRGIIDALTNGSIRSVLIAASLIRPTTSAAPEKLYLRYPSGGTEGSGSVLPPLCTADPRRQQGCPGLCQRKGDIESNSDYR